MNKAELRTLMRAERRALPSAAQDEAARAVFAQIRTFEPYQQARTVMAYMACRGELSLEAVIRDALATGKTLLLPRCESPGVMTARRIHDMDDLVPGAYGLPEPEEDCEIVQPQDIDLILVPGVAFDRMGHRLGQGGGYYDRMLRESRALRVGVCHDFALLDCVPCEAHDVNMNMIITPDGSVRMERENSGGHKHG